MLALHTIYTSETGKRPRNEDSCGYWTSDAGCCWVISDGAGGHGSGDKASQLVVGTALQQFANQPVVDAEHVVGLLEGAHNVVMATKRANPTGDDMHATAAILTIDIKSQEAVWGHVGDTRIYLFRGQKIAHQTRDHSLVQNMIDAGYGEPAMIRGHPQRSLLTSAIGNADDLTVSVSGPPTHIEPGDVLFMCTDGWWEYVTESEMESLLATCADSRDWLARMADLVVRRAGDYSDNYTAMVIVVDELFEPDKTVIRRSNNSPSD